TQELAQTLQALIEETFSRGGRVIIPAFSVGRSQEILYLIRYIVNKTGRPIPTYLDSPLSVKATATFLRNVVGYYDSEAMAVIESGQNPILFNGFCAITDVEDSKLLNTSNESCVIISSSGMCEAGRIRHHLKHNLYKPNNTIVFTGYQAGGTLGERILSGADTVSILGEQIAVKAKITKLEGISGHADKDGLLQWIDKFSPKPKHVFVVHGDAKTSRYFAGLLKESRAINARAPEPDTSVLLK
ncbi:MAG: MBL fold metallo-hydrolase RNA specificity domain-containing protein, partial [Spirochaetales bacterium]